MNDLRTIQDLRTRTEAIELLEQRIEESGLKTGAFARDVLIREPRTVRRWLDGSSPIPLRVKEWLVDPKAAPWPLPIEEEREVLGPFTMERKEDENE